MSKEIEKSFEEVELTPLIKREIIKQTMKEIQELYYDIEEPQDDYDWHCDKGMVEKAIVSTIENLLTKVKKNIFQKGKKVGLKYDE